MLLSCEDLSAISLQTAIFDQFSGRLMKLLEDSDGFPQMEQDESKPQDFCMAVFVVLCSKLKEMCWVLLNSVGKFQKGIYRAPDE